LKQVEVIRRQHGAEQVTEVRVELGPLSGIETLLLVGAFERLVSETTAANANLVIDEVALCAECEACRCEFEVIDFVFRCPTCGGNVRVICGDQCQLVSVSLGEVSTSSSSEPGDKEEATL